MSCASPDLREPWEVTPRATRLVLRLYPNNFDQPGNKTNIDNDAVTLALSASDATGGTLYYTPPACPPA